MKQKHTQEPWQQFEHDKRAIVSEEHPNLSLLSIDDDGLGIFFEEKDARRVVACVNACAGIPTDDLDLCPHGGLFHLAAHANQLVEQNKELAADCHRYKSKMIANAERTHAYGLDNEKLIKQRDDLQRELAQVKAAMKAQAEAMARRRHELIDMRDLLGKTLILAAVCLEPNTSSATARQIDRALSAWKHMKGGE